MAPIVRLLKATPNVEARVCVTAQHRQMLDQVLSLFEINTDYDLDLMRENQSLAQLSAAIFTNLDPVFADFKPDWVLAQGDTTTVAITSLLAYYHRIKFGHVEAGLRTHDKWQPFPEEINRRIAGVTVDMHFAPTDWSMQNLLREGVDEKSIVVTGNTVIDALQYVPEADLGALVTALHRVNQRKHPLGIVGIISAFNFPVAVWAWNSMLAAVCGNVSIWKPSEKTPLTAIACISPRLRITRSRLSPTCLNEASNRCSRVVWSRWSTVARSSSSLAAFWAERSPRRDSTEALNRSPDSVKSRARLSNRVASSLS